MPVCCRLFLLLLVCLGASDYSLSSYFVGLSSISVIDNSHSSHPHQMQAERNRLRQNSH